IDAVREFFERNNANIHRGIYPLAEKATAKIEEVRGKVAKFINASDVSEIVFTHGTTEALNLLASSYGSQFSQKKGVLLTEMEHHSNLIPWQHYAELRNSPVEFLTVGGDGVLDGRIIDSDGNEAFNTMNMYSVISFAHVSNVLGAITTPKSLFEKNQKIDTKAAVIVDAAQSVPHMPVDVKSLQADYITFSGHKMLSPAGVGILWGKQNLLNKVEPLLYGSQMIVDVSLGSAVFQKPPYLFESGTLPLEGIVGLGAAIDYLSDIGMDKIREHEIRLISYAIERLKKVDGITIYGPLDPSLRSGVISFNLRGIHPHDIAQVLGSKNICVRAGHHCAMPLHKKLGIPASVRISFGIYNDEEDIEAVIEGLQSVSDLFH
ncbi:MAG: hypothetical protein RLZZ455_1242, partial [Candidatus Parcubacteria bacterium]